ncbi:MAG: methionyl-tRNA formyltransferase [Salinivirgaceae bacterium]|nr:methionyl-tRNA formyltransferase [Salinivirgaceae bacterium]
MYSKESLRIVFMGTPDFAVESLKALIDNGYNVVGVVTTPDKPAGRGQKLSESAVKQFAVSKGLPVLQPEKLKDADFQDTLRSWKADLQVIVAFRMLPESVWSMPPLGSINVHASLLPNYRGAAPINRAIMNGETESGVTTFLLKHEIDTGDILQFERTPITANDNAGTLHDRLMIIGAGLLIKTVEQICAGNTKGTPQSDLMPADGILKGAPKIFKDDCRIDWNAEPQTIINQIRGLSPYPAAFSNLQRDNEEPLPIKIFCGKFEQYSHNQPFGKVSTDGKSYIKVYVEGGTITLGEVQLAGKKRMPVADFLRGFKTEGVELEFRN